jgi:predicted methyltransferase
VINRIQEVQCRVPRDAALLHAHAQRHRRTQGEGLRAGDHHPGSDANVDIAAFNKLVFDSLKPGGVYFIEDHPAAAGKGATQSPDLHRIEEKTVIDEVTAAGFELVGHSDILRNPADDHTKVVFDTSIRLKTDQFLLTFRRP